MSISPSPTKELVPPVFMFGFERSGTTLLSMMVGAHPDIAVPLTVTGMWYRYARRLRDYGEIERRETLERLVDDLLAEERIKLWDVVLTREELLHELTLGSYPAVVDRFHRLYACHKGKPHWGNLDIATLDEMDQAKQWFPNARFLHIVRDGRDVALSHETMPYGASNTLETAETWNQRLRTNLKMGAMIEAQQYRVVRYEDLVSDSEKTLNSICQFLGVEYSPAMLDYPKMVDEKVPKERRWLWPALDKPPDRSKIAGWKTNMSVTKRTVFEGAAGRLLQELDYEAYNRVPRSVPAYLYELWCFLGRGGRFRRIRSRLGLNRPSKLERMWRESSSSENSSLQRQSFGVLVRNGVYDKEFQHSTRIREFFEACLHDARARIETANNVRVLDCGCGPGAWMGVVERSAKQDKVHCYGFDLTPEMVEVARARLEGRVPAEHIQQGDILADASYVFGGDERTYQIIYAFDVVQQLPRRKQFDAVLAMLNRLDAGGCAIVFDHERWSPFGLRMGFRKLVTKYLHVGLVPRYYCNARYPALARFAARIARSGRYSTKINTSADGKKRALLIWRQDTAKGL